MSRHVVRDVKGDAALSRVSRHLMDKARPAGLLAFDNVEGQLLTVNIQVVICATCPAVFELSNLKAPQLVGYCPPPSGCIAN